jgi:hypothetical protein
MVSGGKNKRSCFHLDFLIIEFCQIFQEWKDSKIENWEDLELWNKNTEAGTKWWTRSKAIFLSLSNDLCVSIKFDTTHLNQSMKTTQLFSRWKVQKRIWNWRMGHKTHHTHKKKGVDKHVEWSIYTKLQCNCTTIPTKLQYRIAPLVF